MAGQGKRVVIHGLTTAVASKPVQPAEEAYPLAVLDHLMAYHALRLVFYYKSVDSDGDSAVEGVRKMGVASVRESLAELLALYPVVCGRLRRDVEGNWEVKYSDTGARTRLAKVHGAGVEEWLETATAEEEKELVHWEEMLVTTSRWSPYNVQINEFERGGVAVGLSLTHMHADPTCATILVKSWAEQNCRAAITHPPFCLVPALRGRTNSNTNTASVQFYEAKSMAKPAPKSLKMLTATFRFPEPTVQALLTEVQQHCPEASPFDALAALFWWRVTAGRNNIVATNEHNLTVCFDLRKLMHAPLPHGFYGNAIHFTKISVDGTHMDGAGELGRLAAAIRSHLSQIKEEEYWSVIDWVESRRDQQGKFPPPFQMYGPELTVVNLEHLFAYKAAFAANGPPLHFSCRVENAEGEGLILVLPSPEDGLGRTVTVTLPEEQLAKICKDVVTIRPGVSLMVSDN